MRSNLKKLLSIYAAVLMALSLHLTSAAQSTDPNYPTPVETNEINGAIKARDMGDSRATSYFYTFDGGQGDIFINVVTRNFAGDIDVFAADALRPLAKMVIYPNDDTSETGRLIYLRKGERLVLRVEGRSPNDDPAEFRIKFGGSFIAITGQKVDEAPTVARTGSANEPGVKVNSVGTIIAVVPKPQPTVATTPEVTETVAEVEPAPVKPVETEPVEKPAERQPPRVVVTSDVATVFSKKPPRAVKPKTTPAPKPPARARRKTAAAAKVPVETPPAEPQPNPLASIRLVVELKDGNVLELPMSEVAKFNFDKGVLTVTGKDGKTTRYSILDVSKVTIQ